MGRLDLLESDKTEARAASLLHGLGFTKEMQAKKTRDFSGGWRMRIALARALFTPTDLLLLGMLPFTRSSYVTECIVLAWARAALPDEALPEESCLISHGVHASSPMACIKVPVLNTNGS